MAYQKTQWNTKDPITQERMNHIEQGIEDAHNLADAANQSSTISGLSSDINSLYNVVGRSQSEGMQLQIVNLTTAVSQAAGENSPGSKSYVQILGATTNNETPYDNLDARFTAIENKVNSEETYRRANSDSINEAKRTAADSLVQRFRDVESNVSTLESSYNSLNTTITNAGNGGSLSQRLNQDESRIQTIEEEILDAHGTNGVYVSLDNRFNIIQNELKAAHESGAYQKTTALGNAYNSLDERFEAIETEIAGARGGQNNIDARLDAIDDSTNNGSLVSRINTAETTISGLNGNLNTVTGRVTSLETGKVNISDIKDNLTSTDTNKPLSANQGKELKTLIDNLDTAYKAADTALDGRLDTAESDIDALETELNATNTGLKDRITSAETRLNGLDGANGAISQLDGRLDTAETDIDALERTINTEDTGLVAKVTALEKNPQSTTVVIENVTYNSSGIPTNISNPSADIDYLLKKDDNYYYWKYINNTWQLISGAGEGGTSSAEFYADFPQNPSDTVDYFIGSGTSYIHYRWHNNAWVQILPAHLINNVSVDTSTVSDGITKSKPIIKEIGSETNLLSDFTAIKSIGSTTEENGATTLTWVSIDGDVGSVTITGGGGGSGTNITASITRITNSPITTISGETCNIEYQYMAMESEQSTYETTGQGTWYINGNRVATQEVINGNNSFNIAPYLNIGTNNISLSVTISADGQTITRTKTWVVNVVNFSLIWNYNESTVQSGSTINFSCTPYGTDITKTLHLKVGIYEQTQTVTTSGIPVTVTLPNNFEHGNYTAEMWMTATINGAPETTSHISHDFIVVEQGNNTPIIAATLPKTTMDQYDTITIPFVVYTPNSSLSTVTLSANGVTQDIREDVNRATQTWNYTPSTLGTNIVYDESDPPQPISGTHTLTITSGSVTKTLIITVNSVRINNAEIGGYVFKLKASELPSNSALQSWHYDDNDVNNTKLQFSNNFDWINGGIKTENDENGQLRQYIRVKSGTTMSIPYQMFSSALPDVRRDGCNFKIIFKVENCRNYDATVATNIVTENGTPIGIQLNAHNAIFKSNTTQVSTQYGENEYTELEFEVYKNHTANNEEANNPYMMAWIDGVITSARPYDGNFTQTNASNIIIGSNDCDVCVYLVKYYPTVLSIADHISNFIADAPNASEMIKRFNRNDIFYTDSTDIDPYKLAQKNRDCRVWLYEIPRMTTGKKDYVRKVNFQQIYKNGTAYQDGLHGIGTLTVQGTSSVNYRKGAANTDINFYDTDAEPLEGETFANYSQLFDGENNNLLYDTVNGEQVLKPVTERGYKINSDSIPITYSNMKVNFASCEQVNNMCNAEWYQQFQPYPSLSTRDCMEFVMGVQFIKDHGEGEPTGEVILFNEKGANRDPNKFYMYSIGNLGTSKKNTHIFHSDNECCVEVMNNQNAGCRMISVPSDLDADYTAYLNEDYESMTNYDWGGKVKSKDHSYEMRFPDTKSPDKEIKAGWARFVKWMAENNPGAATNAAITTEVYEPYTFKGHKRAGTQVLQGTTINQYAGTYTTDSFERRMAKMLSECEDYMAMDSVIYHFLFIERHTMVDNVAKNTFWSAAKTNQYINGVEQADTEGYWIWDLSKNYDNDTSDGNNNEGQLIFDYGNEAADRQDGKAVFNASDAVWFVFASNLYEACQTMFQNRESATSKNGKWQNAWSASNYHTYLLNEQRKVPERVWNECYWYDYLRTFETGKVYNEETDKDIQIIDKSWITFLDGGQKTHQRQHYETFEELYDASKYRSNFSTANSITLRGYTPDPGDPSLEAVPAKSEITVKMYNKCYITAHFDNNIETQKAGKGEYVTLQYLESNGEYGTLSDTVINLDTASMIQEISDLAPLYPGLASFSKAIRLRSIKIGDSTPGYNNPHITNTETGTVDFGANYMLEHLELQNLSNANQPLNLTGCPALTYLDASGSTFTSIIFANGGLLTEAYINNPTNLVMRNLDFLTKNNFHLTDTTAVTQLRLEGCKLFDKKSFIEELTNLNIIRLSGIDWTLDNNTLLNRLLGIMGMNELGYTVAQSYLAGTVSLTGTTYQGDYIKYTNAWSPDLTINATGSFIYQHLATYYNIDGTKLYETYINSGDPLIDPYARGLLDTTPTKTPDVQYSYTFGELDNAEIYIPFSGWRESGETQSIYSIYSTSNPNIPVTGDIQLYAVYSTSPQRYIVRWLLDENRVVSQTQSGQNYGGGYNLVAPTIKDVQALYDTYTFTLSGETCSYSIMTGWNKLPTNITPTTVGTTYDIYANWLTRTNVNYNEVLTSDEYSVEEKLLVLKRVQAARNSSLSIADKFYIQMGYNGLKPAIDLVSTPKRYSGTATTINTYEPFSANKSFTIAIDYRFEPVTSNISNEAVLLSCYSDTDQQGFKLYYDPQSGTLLPQISFGDTSQSTSQNRQVVGSSITNRNMVVLRHRAGENILYVYTGSGTSGLVNEYSSSNFRKSITWSSNISNAKIVLGGINTTDASIMNATGTLYSVKYWEEDLGEGECMQLANWCHETIEFAVSDYREADSHSGINTNLTSAIILHTLNASEMGTYTIPQLDTTNELTIGWNPSAVRTLYNNRIYYGLPILLQSILTPMTTIPYKSATYTTDNGYVINTNTPTSQDYIFAPSCIEVGATGSTASSHASEATGAYAWYSGSLMTVKSWNNGNLDTVISGSANYTNLRFPYRANELNNSVTVYINYPNTSSSFYLWLRDEQSITIKSGDILIPTNSTVAYMYVTAAELNKGAPVTNNNTSYLSNTIGGWIESTGWWTRSVPDQNSNRQIAKFQYINDLGALTVDRDKEQGIVYSIAL